MFDKILKNIIINTYKYLKDSLNIIGQKRIDFITNNYKCHITTLYGWNKEIKNNSNDIVIYNKNINPLLENIIYKCINEYKITSVIKIKKYINKNFDKQINQKTINFILKKNNLECEKYKIKKEINKFIIDSFSEYKITTAKDIINQIFIKYNIKLSETSIYNVLKQNKITYKKIKVKTNPYTLEEQKYRLLSIKDTLNFLDKDKIISYDEISACTNENPKYGWSKKGYECIINKKDKSLYGTRYTIGMAINNKSIVDFTIVKGGLKTNDFIDFMQKIKDKDPDNKNTYFMDNASIHQSKIFRNFAINNKMHILYNAPYHSDKNPIEYFFSLLRKEIERNIFNSIEELTLLINNLKKKINNNCLNNIFRHSFELFNNII